MVSYLLRRVFQTVIFLIVSSLFIYTLVVMLMPSGPEATYSQLKAASDPANVDILEGSLPPTQTGSGVGMGESGTYSPTIALEQTYKLNNPWPLNFFVWMFDTNSTSQTLYDTDSNSYVVVPKGIDLNLFGWHLRGSGILTGDFGVSTRYSSGTLVSALIAFSWQNSLLLLAASLILAFIIGVPIGIISAGKQDSPLDNAFGTFSLIGLSFPPYTLGFILILLFAIFPKDLYDHGLNWLPWLPSGDAGADDFISHIGHSILPAITLAIPQIGWISRQTRQAMVEVLQQDYIRTARAKGVPVRAIIVKHAFRNALVPIVTYIGTIMSALISSLIVVETVFAYEGLGQTLYMSLGGCTWADVGQTTGGAPPCPGNGIFPMDYPVALTFLLIVLIVIAMFSLLADILYAATNPRYNYGKGGAGE